MGPKCFKCRKYAGHLAKDCPLNKKNRQSNMIAVSKDPEACGEDTAVESHFEEMALTSSEKHQLNNGWFIDSGASKHMTYDRKNIISISLNSTHRQGFFLEIIELSMP